MRYISLALFAVVIITPLFAQDGDKEAVKKTIEMFFEGFHEQDSTLIKQSVSKDIILQTIVESEEGKAHVRKESFSDFLKAIVGIPTTTRFKEVLKEYSIKTDGLMAQVWTPYEFWVNGSISHCGVNAFQLIKNEGVWTIIYLIDTRRKEGCF